MIFYLYNDILKQYKKVNFVKIIGNKKKRKFYNILPFTEKE